MASSLNPGIHDNRSVSNVALVVTACNWMSPLSDNTSDNATKAADNLDEADNVCMWFVFAVNTVLIGLLCVFGSFGNMTSLYVLERDRRNRVAVFLLQSLAIADTLVLCAAFVELSVFYGLLPVIGRLDEHMAIAPYLVKYVNPVGNAVQSCAIWITVLLAVNRYVAICRPFSAARWLRMRRTRLQVALVVAVSILLNLPRFFSVSILSSADAADARSNITARSNRYSYSYTTLGRNFYFKVIYLNVFYTSFVLILPLVLVMTLNVLLVRSLHESKRRMRLSSLERYDGRSERNITVVMVAIIIELVLCHTPDRVLQVTVAVLRDKQGPFNCPHAMSYAYDICNMLMIVSSSTNFIIYFLLRPHFRASLRDRLMCADTRQHDEGSLQSAGPWNVETGRVVDRIASLKAAVERNNHVDASQLPVEGPLLSAMRRNRTSTM